MKASNISFARVEIRDLERLGWTFDGWDASTSSALDITEDEAIEYNREKYIAIISVQQNGRTLYDWENKSTAERSDWEHTGDDEKTMQDLATLLEQGKLWDVEYYEED